MSTKQKAKASGSDAERIQTLHPEGKQGVNILRSRYDVMLEAIRSELAASGELALADLHRKVSKRLGTGFDGSVAWYFTVVKLDMQARGKLERIAHRGPQHVRLIG